MRQATLVYLVEMENGKPRAIYLGEKKSRYVAGWLNTAGGKVDLGEDVRTSAAREMREKWKVEINPEELRSVAVVQFLFPSSPEANLECHVFLAESWRGEPRGTEELGSPTLFPITSLPWDRMPPADRHWLPQVLSGQFVEMSIELDDTFSPRAVLKQSFRPQA